MDKIDPKNIGISENIIQNNAEKLKLLFPIVFSEGKIDFEKLREILGDYIENGPERYSFCWSGKTTARRIAQTPSSGTLRPLLEESINWNTTQNIFIEGDNLEVLKLLQKTYHKKIKTIYIDPPYNTGKEFIYPDRFQDNLSTYLMYSGQSDNFGYKFSENAETSGRFHTNWLNMMYPRISLARNLLRDDGAIFISIDDGEVANLRKLCDEIFGEENFVANIIWEKKYTRSNDAKWFSDNHDHVLCYARLKESFSIRPLPRSDSQIAAYSNPDNHPKGPWKATPLHAKSGSNSSSYRFQNGCVWTPPIGTYRRYSDGAMAEMEENDEIWFGLNGDQTPARKSFLSEVKEGVTPVTIWKYDEVGHNHEANNELKELGLGGLFNNPKPTRLIRRMCLLSDTALKDGIILDFFGGSATTADAVVRQNYEDGGKRRFIVVQLPEPCDPKSEAAKAGFETISNLAKERIRRTIRRNIDGKTKDNQMQMELVAKNSKIDAGFKVFKLDASNIKSWDADFNNLEDALFNAVENIKPDRNEADVLYELLLKYGLDLAVPIEERQIAGKTVYIIGGGALIVCLADKISLETVEGIAGLKKELNPAVMRVVFKDAGFVDDVVKTNALQILRQAGIEDVKSL